MPHDAPQQLADLGHFLAALRINGVPVAPEDLDRLRQLFALQPHLDRQGLQHLLSTLLVKTPEQRQTFEALFADWCPDYEADWRPDSSDALSTPPAAEPEPPPLTVPPAPDTSTPASSPRLVSPYWLALAGVVLLALVCWVVWSRPVLIAPPQKPPEVAAKLPPETPRRPDILPATPVAKVWFWSAQIQPFSVPRRLQPLELLILGLGTGTSAGIVWYRYRRTFREPQPMSVSTRGYGWQPLPALARDDGALLAAAERQQLVWNIAHFLADDPTRRLDLPHTVDATARAGGFVHLHFQPAVYDRTIWFWMDRQLTRPMPRTAVQQLLAILSAAGLEARQGLFTDVPERVDWPAQAGYIPEYEEGPGRQALVAIFTDGEGLAQRLTHPLSRSATVRLLRALQHWPRLCFVDCSPNGTSLRALLAPYRMETIAPAEVPAWLGGVARQDRTTAEPGRDDDARAWAAAVALGGAAPEMASVHSLRVALQLRVSPWQSEYIVDEVRAPEARRWHINWLLRCEPPEEDGLPPVGGLFRRALDWWQQRYRQAAAQMQAQENPLLPWRQSLASRRWQVEQALLQLYLEPEEAARHFVRLANAELAEEIRARLSVLAAAEHRPAGADHERRVIYCPWRLADLSATTRHRLRRLGFAAQVYTQTPAPLQASSRLLLAVSMLGMLALTALGSAVYHWLTPDVPRFLVQNPLYEHPVLVAQTVRQVEALGNATYQVTLGSARQTVSLPQVPAGAHIPVSWHWQEDDNALQLGDNVVLRAGRLAQPIRACSKDWPQRSLVVIAAAFAREEARQLAIRLLDKGSADQVLLGERWEDVLPEWLGSSQALKRATQVLVVLPQAAAVEGAVSRMAEHPGPWAVVTSADFAGVARQLAFDGSQVLEQVDAPWRVQRSQGQVWVAGGPLRQDEAGISWLQMCPGTFTMGRLPGEDPVAEGETSDDWKQWFQKEVVEPPRLVALSGFQMASTETTQQQYGEAGEAPKAEITWAAARTFCQGKGGDLPTEAQWEYAARGGSRFPWSFGEESALLGEYAWFADNSANQAQDVGKKLPNPLGLYDVHGNVWEWVLDWFGDYTSGIHVNPAGPGSGQCWLLADGKLRLDESVACRVVRGGSFLNAPERLRSADRGNAHPENLVRDAGFRCVRVPPALQP